MATNVDNYADLQNMQNDLTEDYTLTTDIDCDGETNFVPVGTDGSEFTGTFDGGGYTISNFTVSRDAAYNGLFGAADGCTYLKNLILSGNVTDTGSNSHSGGFIGKMTGCTVSNIHTNVNVTGTGPVGGFLGGDAVTSTITNCSSTGTVVGNVDGFNTGGFAGGSLSNTSNCFATGDVTGRDVCGFAGGGDITQCYATGNVTANAADSFIGGFVRSGNGTTNCYSTGNIDTAGYATTYVGGFSSITGPNPVQNCYAFGDVDGGDSSTFVGGFAGAFPSANVNCYATGTVTGKGGATGAGGLVGVFFGPGSATNCYFVDAGSDNGLGTLEGGGISAFYPATHNVYDTQAPNWDFSTPIWYAHAAALPDFEADSQVISPLPTFRPS